MTDLIRKSLSKVLWLSYSFKALDLSSLVEDKKYWVMIRQPEELTKITATLAYFEDIILFKGDFFYTFGKIIYDTLPDGIENEKYGERRKELAVARRNLSLLQSSYMDSWIVLPAREKIQKDNLISHNQSDRTE